MAFYLILLYSFEVVGAFYSGYWKIELVGPIFSGRSCPFTTNQSQWLSTACPSEAYYEFDCCHRYSNSTAINQKTWIPLNSTYRIMTPDQFLSRFRNRRIVFSGDSVTQQLWSHIVCNLSHHAYTTFDMDWGLQKKKNVNCPFADGTHCHLPIKGTVHFHSVNLTILYRHIGWFYIARGQLREIFRGIEVQESDILIFNFGLHYNKFDGEKVITLFGEEDYKNALRIFADDVKTLNLLQSTYFLESTPQHFDGPNSSGHWHTKGGGYKCAPLANEATAAESDWRNGFLHNRSISNLPDKMVIVKLAHALYSEWSDHVGQGKNTVQGADCTHWCKSSHVLEFMKMSVFSYLNAHS